MTDEEEEGGGGKRLESCEKAMKSVKVALRAKVRSWKGRRGGCLRRGVSRMGLRTLVRMGVWYGRVMVWISRTKRPPKKT